MDELPCVAVADQFSRVFTEPEFKGKFRAFVFAVLENRHASVRPTENRGKLAPFHKPSGG